MKGRGDTSARHRRGQSHVRKDPHLRRLRLRQHVLGGANPAAPASRTQFNLLFKNNRGIGSPPAPPPPAPPRPWSAAAAPASTAPAAPPSPSTATPPQGRSAPTAPAPALLRPPLQLRLLQRLRTGGARRAMWHGGPCGLVEMRQWCAPAAAVSLVPSFACQGRSKQPTQLGPSANNLTGCAAPADCCWHAPLRCGPACPPHPSSPPPASAFCSPSASPSSPSPPPAAFLASFLPRTPRLQRGRCKWGEAALTMVSNNPSLAVCAMTSIVKRAQATGSRAVHPPNTTSFPPCPRPRGLFGPPG